MNLPTSRNFGWTLKTLSSAQTEINTLPSGQVELLINHQTIMGINTDMLLWWFEHFPFLEIIKDGVKYSAYDLWHPFDHIAVFGNKEKGKVEQGDELTINECFQRNPKYYLKEKAIVFYFREDGFGLQGEKFGMPIMQLVHKFKNIEDGVSYKSRMILGVDSGFLKFFINKIIIPRKFGKQKANAWLRHNVEEVGCFENFLAEIYAKRNAENIINLDN